MAQNGWATSPIELIWSIAHEIEHIDDLQSFRSTCQAFKQAIDAPSFWRKKFFDTFDEPDWMEYLDNPAFQTWWLRRTCIGRLRSLQRPDHPGQSSTIEELIKETLSFDPDSKNASLLEDTVVAGAGIWQPMVIRDPQSIVNKMVLFHLSHRRRLSLADYEASRAHAKHARPQRLVDSKDEIDLPQLAHLGNILQEHLSSPTSTLLGDIIMMSDEDRPRGWQGVLQDGVLRPLQRRWKGIRADDTGDDVEFAQWPGTVGAITSFKFHMVENPNHVNWQPAWDRIEGIDRRPDPADKHIQVEGTSYNGTGFGASGWVRPACSPYVSRIPGSLIPGWGKLTMVGGVHGPGGLVDMLAYEAVILPGSQILIGKWWTFDGLGRRDGMRAGPFMMWTGQIV